jgi:hypothetical protein
MPNMTQSASWFCGLDSHTYTGGDTIVSYAVCRIIQLLILFGPYSSTSLISALIQLVFILWLRIITVHVHTYCIRVTRGRYRRRILVYLLKFPVLLYCMYRTDKMSLQNVHKTVIHSLSAMAQVHMFVSTTVQRTAVFCIRTFAVIGNTCLSSYF